MEDRKQNLFDLILALSDGMDLVSAQVANHHRRTAFIAAELGRCAGLTDSELKELVIAALIHDIGAFSLKERIDLLNFDVDQPWRHAHFGFNLLTDFGPLTAEARIIRNHHAWWQPESSREPGGEDVPLASHILHLADRMSVLLEEEADLDVLGAHVLEQVAGNMGTMFRPDLMNPLLEAAQSREFWVGALQPDEDVLRRISDQLADHQLSDHDLVAVARIFKRFIDYRSHFTATHSAGVAAVGQELAGFLGFSAENRRLMEVACCLHDVGKLAIPTELIEKPGSLTTQEYNQVQDHALYTRRLLERIPALGHGITWAAQHHERMDGTGYPYHSHGSEVFFGSRVVAVADVFTAITEDRPHRRGIDKNGALKKLGGMRYLGSLDQEVVSMARERFDELNRARVESQFGALKDYESVVGVG
jgi:HD-GYP domain-containing protein (c-di-GMP phosphodiesterase class II)